MSAHLNALTGQFLLSEQLIPAGKDQFYDLQNGGIVLGDLLVPKLGNTLFDGATLDLHFANDKSLTDRISGKDLITFTRASTGTYVGSDGLIKTSPYNLLEYSEQIGFAGFWNINNAASGTVTLNSATAPDGTTTATTVVSSADFYGPNNFTVVPASTVYTFSVWVKNLSETIAARINMFGKFVSFLNGALSNIDPTLIATSIEPFPNNWYRITLTADSGAGGNLAVALYGNAGNSFQCWGAQLEEGSTATTYIPTTSVASGAPRFDHDPVTGECLGLLIEESRTNYIDNSNDLSQWNRVINSATTESNTADTLSPDGTNNSTKITGVSNSGMARDSILSASASTAYVSSIFAKKGSTDSFTIEFGSGANNIKTTFNLTTKTFSGSGASGWFVSFSTSYIEYPNGWVRVILAGMTSGSASGGINFAVYGISSGYAYFWGTQVETGSFPTSYIPTSGSTVTRSADVAEITGTNFSSWYNQSEGTTFVSYNKPWSGVWRSYRGFFRVSDSAAPGSEFISWGSTNGNGTVDQVFWSAQVGTVEQLQFTFYSAPGPGKYSHAIAIATNNASYARGGQILGNDTSVTIPIVDQATFGATNTHLSRITYFPVRKTDEELQELTS